MSSERPCCCGGRCGAEEPVELNRRDFLGKMAAGTTGLALTVPAAWAEGGKEAAPLEPG